MSLEMIPNPDTVLTPEIIRNLAEKYRQMLSALRAENNDYLSAAEMIESKSVQKEILARLGHVSIKASAIENELSANLN